MSAVVRIPTPLRTYVDGQAEVPVRSGTVGEVMAELTQRYPELRRHLYTEDGALRNFVNLYLNEDEVRHLDGDRTPVTDHDTITIVPSIAGGGRDRVSPRTLVSPARVVKNAG